MRKTLPCLLLTLVCLVDLRATSEPTPAIQPARVEGTRRSITLPNYNPDMPEGPDRKLFLNTCTSCHSARYVAMQCDFPRTTWVAEVSKMRKAFGCPVSDAQVDPIVNYLTTVRGKK